MLENCDKGYKDRLQHEQNESQNTFRNSEKYHAPQEHKPLTLPNLSDEHPNSLHLIPRTSPGQRPADCRKDKKLSQSCFNVVGGKSQAGEKVVRNRSVSEVVVLVGPRGRPAS